MAVAVRLWCPSPVAAMPDTEARPGWGTNGHVSAIVQVGNIAIVGGTFTEVAENGGSGPATLARNNIVAFDTTTGEPLPDWAPDVNGEVAALAVSPDGSKIYAGGAFTTVDGLTRTRLVALDAATGAVDTTWKPAAGYTVEALLVSGGRVYIGGAFTTIGGKPRPYLAAVDAATGKLDTTWAPAASEKVRALAASPDGSRVYAGGDFTTVAGVTRKNLVALDPVTGAVLDWNPGPNYPVLGIAVDSSHVFTAGGGSANSLASWDPSTGTPRWVKTSDGDFQAIGVSGGIVYAGGHFLYYDGHLEPKRIVAVDADTGNLRPDWLTRVRGGTEGVWAISLSADRVLLGGDFTDVGLEPHAHYAQFDGPTDGPVEAEEPSAPAALFAGAVGGSKVNLSWQASTDDVGVSGYVVLRDGVEIGRAGETTYADETVQPSTRYTYAVRAFDSAGHLSAPSNSAAAITGPPDQVLAFSPTDDAYVDSAFPDNNTGTSATLKVDGDPLKEMLLKFAVSGIGNRQVVSAKLRLYCTDSSNDGGHVHRASTNDWNEETVTWNTAPTALFPEITDLSDVDAGNWYTVDVTPLVTGDGDVSAVIDSMISNAAQYASRDATSGNGPQLVINVATGSALPFSDGFETRDFSQWTSVTGLVTQQDEVFSGGWAARATTTGPARFATKDLTETQTDVYQQLRFKILSQGVNSVVLLRPRTNTGASLLKLYLDSAGRLAYRNDVAGTTATTSIKPAKGVWHTLQLHTLIDGAAGQVEVWLDGSQLAALSKTEALGTTPIGRLQLGEDSTGRTYDIAYDDVTVDSTFVPDTSPPSVPLGLIASAPAADEVDLAWAAATDDIGVATYEIYRDGALIDTVGGGVTAYVDRSVDGGTTYEYTVQAIDAARNSSGSSEPVSVTTPPPDTSPPSIPTGVNAAAVSFDRVDLSWSPSSDDVGVDRYGVYRDGGLIATVGGSASSYRDTDVAASTDYVYTVDAVDAAGNASGQSDPAAARTQEQAVFRDGFESGDLSQWTSATGLAVDATETFSGAFGARATTTSAAAYATKQLATGRLELYYQMRFKVLGQGANSIVLARLRTATSGGIVKLYLDGNGKLAYRNDVAGTTSTTSSVPSRQSWHTVQLHALVDASGGQVELWLDGARIVSKVEPLGSVAIGRVQLGDDASGRSYDVVYDDLVVDTSPIPDTTPPSRPRDLAATVVAAHEVDLTWTAAADDLAVTGYEVYRDGALIDTLGSVTSYADRSVAGATSYEYSVRALDAAGNRSPASDPANATTPPADTTAPSTPTGLTATAVSFDRVDLAWSASSDDVGVDHYRVYRDGSVIATLGGATTTYRDTDVAGSTDYSYAVDAVDASDNASARSDPATARTPRAAVFRDGFESGDLSQWTSSTGLTVDGTETFSGAFGARATTTSAEAYATKQLTTGYPDLYYVLRFKVLSQGANSIVLARVRTASGGGIVKLYLDGNGKLAYRNDVAGTTSTSSSVPSRQTWHTAQLHALVDASAGQVELWLDGARILSKVEPLGDAAIGRVELGDGATGRTYDVAYDDVAIDTAPFDTVAPAVSLAEPADGSVTSDATPGFAGVAGTAAGDANTVQVKVYAGGAPSGDPVVTLSAPVDGGAGWSVDATDALADGTYTAQAEQSDAAGNLGRSTAHTFTVAATPAP